MLDPQGQPWGIFKSVGQDESCDAGQCSQNAQQVEHARNDIFRVVKQDVDIFPQVAQAADEIFLEERHFGRCSTILSRSKCKPNPRRGQTKSRKNAKLHVFPAFYLLSFFGKSRSRSREREKTAGECRVIFPRLFRWLLPCSGLFPGFLPGVFFR